MVTGKRIRQFLLPRLTRKFFIRLALVILFSYLIFAHVLTPVRIDGISMEPTYRNGGYTLLFKLRYLFSSPRRGDVVALRIGGERVMLLKRVVALEGDTVEFRAGRLYVNEKPAHELYVQKPCNWNLPRRTVEAGCAYVIGDNRSMPIQQHQFGRVSVRRIVGAPLW